jgi:hypothetical protein
VDGHGDHRRFLVTEHGRDAEIEVLPEVSRYPVMRDATRGQTVKDVSNSPSLATASLMRLL